MDDWQVLWDGAGRDVRLARGADAFRSPFDGEPFALLVVAAHDVPEATRARLADDVVAAGCRYAACWGEGGAAWQESIDLAYLASCPDSEPADDTLVVTSVHDRELVADAVWYLLRGTAYNDVRFCGHLILVVGADAALEREIAGAVRRVLAS